MFYYWNGFEIDGSDTDYDIVLPERKQIKEFVECFLTCPLFTDTPKPDIYTVTQSPSYNRKEITPEALYHLLEQGNYPAITIDINCKHVELLTPELKEQIYGMSQTRDPLEKGINEMENPCTAPMIQQGFTRGDMTVELTIHPPENRRKFLIQQPEQIDGYVRHPEILSSPDLTLPCFTINVGPGYYYEYARYLFLYLEDHFPGIGIGGGLDCGGGWTDGCTYASSIYAFEKMDLPVKHSPKNTLKRLMEYDIIRPYRQYYKKKWVYEHLKDFLPACREAGADYNKKDAKGLIPFSDYLQLIETQLDLPQTPFDMILNTAVHIILPQPHIYEKNPAFAQKLTQILERNDITGHRAEWSLTGYLSFYKEAEKTFCQLRIQHDLLEYTRALIEAANDGSIEFIKEVTYDRRHSETN